MTRVPLMLALVVFAGVPACEQRYAPELASRPYPEELHTTETVRMQVFRKGPMIEIVNATARSYEDVEVWVNARYRGWAPSIPAGRSVRLDLRDFYDVRGESMSAGGVFREFEPTPLRLVEIQPTPESPMVGLITIRAERAE